jgi:hypothetical protein
MMCIELQGTKSRDPSSYSPGLAGEIYSRDLGLDAVTTPSQRGSYSSLGRRDVSAKNDQAIDMQSDACEATTIFTEHSRTANLIEHILNPKHLAKRTYNATRRHVNASISVHSSS